MVTCNQLELHVHPTPTPAPSIIKLMGPIPLTSGASKGASNEGCRDPQEVHLWSSHRAEDSNIWTRVTREQTAGGVVYPQRKCACLDPHEEQSVTPHPDKGDVGGLTGGGELFFGGWGLPEGDEDGLLGLPPKGLHDSPRSHRLRKLASYQRITDATYAHCS